MKVSATIVTRGDVDLTPILRSLPEEWEVIVWDNGATFARQYGPFAHVGDGYVGHPTPGDLAVYGRYAAIKFATNDLIYVQDDDCIVSDPRAIVQEWKTVEHFNLEHHPGMPYDTHVVCNMPPQFRHDFYREHALVGFGAVFQRDAPQRAFRQWDHRPIGVESVAADTDFFHRRCDLVFTYLTPRVLVDVPHEDLPWASDNSRMWKRPEHQGEGQRMLELMRKVRDAA